jgi:hypothetical protein
MSPREEVQARGRAAPLQGGVHLALLVAFLASSIQP